MLLPRRTAARAKVKGASEVEHPAVRGWSEHLFRVWPPFASMVTGKKISQMIGCDLSSSQDHRHSHHDTERERLSSIEFLVCLEETTTIPVSKMSTSDEASAGHLHRNSDIQHGHTVLFKLPNGEVRGIKVEKDS